jgi:TPR repeat protein
LIDAQGRVVGMMVGAADWDSPDAIELVRHYLRRRHAVPESLDTLETADQAEDDSAYDAYQRGDYAAAYWEWLPLAEEGDAEAQFNLGILYDLGQGVAQSMVKAASWYRKSAEQGFTAAQYNLAVSFANGEGVPQNNVLAYALFDLAAADNPEAAEQRDSMARGITAEEIDRAVRLANRAREDDTAMFLGEVLGAALPAEPGPESESAGPSPELIWTVQEALTALGYDTGATDGMIGSRTRAAVRAFQADTELGVDGQVSEQLLRRLQTALD